MPSVAQAKERVTTEIVVGPDDVRALRNALLQGDTETGRPPLPEGVAMKILSTAEYWSGAKKTCYVPFQEHNLDCLFFKFGAIPGTPKKVVFHITSHDQGWSSYPECHGQENSWTWGEVDVHDRAGVSKLNGRQRVFTNLHAVSHWQTHEKEYRGSVGFLGSYDKGDVLKFYFRSQFPGWCIYVREAVMAVYYEPTFS